jgi:hypothetical protein
MTVHSISKGLLQQDAAMTSVADKPQAATSAIEAAFSAALQRATLNFGGSAGMPSANTAFKERFERQPAQARDDAPKAERPDARRGDKAVVKSAQGPAKAERPKAAAEQKIDRAAPADAAPDRAEAKTDAVDTAADRAADDTQPVEQQAADNQTDADPQATQQQPTEIAAAVAASVQVKAPDLAQILPVEQTAVVVDASATLQDAQAGQSDEGDAGADNQDPFAWLDTNHGDEIASLNNKIDAGAAAAADQADFAASLAAATAKADPTKRDTGADEQADMSALAQQQADLLAEQLAGTTQQVSVTVKVNQAAADAPTQTAGAVLEALGLLDPALQADADAAGQEFAPGQGQNGQGSDSGRGIATAAAQVAGNGALENVQNAGNAAAARPFAAALAAQLEASEPKAATNAGQSEAQPVAGMTGANASQAAQKATPATPAQPASRPLPVPPQHIIDQVNVQIDKQLKDGNDTIKISLKPLELGKIEIKLEVGADGRVTAQVTADRPETLAILQKDSKGLEKALSDAGLKAEETSLSFNLRGEQQQNANNGTEGRRAGRGRGRAAQAIDGRGTGLDTAAAQPRRLSGRSGVDITV